MISSAQPDRRVVAWLDRQPSESIWTSKRRRALELSFALLLHEDLENRVLDFDSDAAVAAAGVAVTRQKAGRTVDIRDTEIAGIAIARRAALATRNVRHFSDLKIPVINPWTE